MREVPPLQKGDVILIYEDNVQRNNWPLGVLTEVHESADGLIRKVTLKTQKGPLSGPIQKLNLLEGHKEHINDEKLKKKHVVLKQPRSPNLSSQAGCRRASNGKDGKIQI